MQWLRLGRNGTGRAANGMAELLVDTDVMIDHLRGARELRFTPDVRLHCSVVTRAELLAGPAEQESAVRALLRAYAELEVTVHVAEAAGLIRRETKLALADSLIAATALAHGLHLMTRNLRHFERVGGLHITTQR